MILTLLKDKGSKYKSRIMIGKTSITPFTIQSIQAESSEGTRRYIPKR